MDSILRIRAGRRLAFTLIEVLVVVAVLALLIAVLLPSLKQAKEQARLAVCLANCSNIATATGAYLNCERDRFPLAPGNKADHEWNGGNPEISSSYFGGNHSAVYWDKWTAADKPLNKYVYPGRVSSAKNAPYAKGPLRVYECPSDRGGRTDSTASSGLQDVITCYQYIGTSYDQNIQWYFYWWNIEQGAGGADRLWELIDRFVLIMRKKGPSRAVVVYEDTADFALSTGMAPIGSIGGFPSLQFKVMGWHGKYEYASMVFLDGHAAYLPVDWRKGRPNPPTNPYGCTSTWAVHQDSRDK